MTPKQFRFVEEYVIDLNAAQASIRAGYSADSAKQIAKLSTSMPSKPQTFRPRGQPTRSEQHKTYEAKRRNEKPWRAWYRLARWRRRRQDQLTSHPLCAMCLKRGQVMPATVADHVDPHRGDAAKFWEGELQSLCALDHDLHKQQQEVAGYSSEVGCDGAPLDPNHPFNRTR